MSDKPNNNNSNPAGLPPIPTPADFFGWLNQMVSPMVQAATNPIANVPTVLDPLGMWKSLAQKNEEFYTKFFQQVVSTPTFTESLGRTTIASSRYRMVVREVAKNYLDNANMPSRDDVTRVSSQIVSLDAKVDDLSDKVSDSLDGLPVILNKLTSSLESLATRLEKVEGQLAAQSKGLQPANAERQQQILDTVSRLEAQLQQQDVTAIGARLAQLESQLSRVEDNLTNNSVAKVEAKEPTTTVHTLEVPEVKPESTPKAKRPASRSKKTAE